MSTRFAPSQLAEAIQRSARGGDPRYFLIRALTALFDEESQTAMERLTDDGCLQAREWCDVATTLADRNPIEFATRTVREGLSSRSLEVQQAVLDRMPTWAQSIDLDHDLTDHIATWFDRRMRSPRREATVSTFEVVDVGLTLALSRGPQTAHTTLAVQAPRMLARERRRFEALPSWDSPDFVVRLWAWYTPQRHQGRSRRDTGLDPTATCYLDGLMKRLSIAPAHPDVATYAEE